MAFEDHPNIAVPRVLLDCCEQRLYPHGVTLEHLSEVPACRYQQARDPERGIVASRNSQDLADLERLASGRNLASADIQ